MNILMKILWYFVFDLFISQKHVAKIIWYIFILISKISTGMSCRSSLDVLHWVLLRYKMEALLIMELNSTMQLTSMKKRFFTVWQTFPVGLSLSFFFPKTRKTKSNQVLYSDFIWMKHFHFLDNIFIFENFLVISWFSCKGSKATQLVLISLHIFFSSGWLKEIYQPKSFWD